MKIRGIETFPLYCPLAQPYGDANGYKHYRSLFLIRITTESGLVGWGECADWLPTLHLGFEKRIIPYLLGKNAMNRAQLVSHIHKWHQRAAAGVSMALTEVIAVAAGLSVCELWGGRWHKSIPVYASFQSYSKRADWQAVSLNRIEAAIRSGFTAFKVKIGGKMLQEDESHLAVVQNLLQYKHALIVDANESYDLATSRHWTHIFSEWGNLLWFEEPMPMKQISDYQKLRSQGQVPIAGGENLQTAAAFLPLLQAGALDVIQPDPLHLPSVDDYRHTLQMARHFGIRTSSHTFDGPLSRLYALFAQACLPPWSKMELATVEPVEWDVMDNPLNQLLPLLPSGGIALVPDGPGIGMELDLALLTHYLWDGAFYKQSE